MPLRLQRILIEVSEHELDLLPAAVSRSSHEVSKYKSKKTDTVYYVKFSSGHYQDKVAHNIHPIIECMAYRIYDLFGIRIPEDIFIVLDKSSDRLGLASQEIIGESSVVSELEQEADINDLFLPSVLMANYDVTGTGPVGANIIISPDKGYYVMDPGASMHFRAQGKRKEFGPDPHELGTMRDPEYPAGVVFGDLTNEELAGDLKDKFAAVSIADIVRVIDETVKEGKAKLRKFKDKKIASQINSQLRSDTTMIKANIKKRYANILKSLKHL